MKVRKFFSLMESSSGMKFYWKLDLKEPYLSKGLKNLGCPEKKFNFLRKKVHTDNYLEVLISCGDYPTNNHNYWDWNGTAYKKSNWDWYDDNGYIYMGVVPVTDQELEDWNMRYDMLKYNL